MKRSHLSLIGVFARRPRLLISAGVGLASAAILLAVGVAATGLQAALLAWDMGAASFILLTLLVPTLFFNWGFLRVLRLWTRTRSANFWRPLNKRGLSGYHDTIQALINLLVFLFVVTSFVYTAFAREGTGIAGYVDALYFTVATVTTTGFGDVTLPGTFGKLASIVIMIIGISLFVRLAQAVFRPNKVTFPCPQCGLLRHDPDAVHCKACGHVLNIPDHGSD